MKVALVHDDLVQWGGAERVLATLAEIFPEAPIYTSVFDENNKLLKEKFSNKKIMTSFIQKIPFWQSMYRILLPLYPLAFESFDFSEYDLVVSQTTRFAKAIITKPQTKHVCYCHTPPRFLWDFSGGKINGFPQLYFNFLRMLDQVISKRVDVWLAGSKNAQERIKKIYQADSKVLYPFVDLERFKEIQPFDGGYLLTVSRLNNYKRVDLVVAAARKINMPLKIVGSGPQLEYLQTIAGPNVEFLGAIREEILPLVLAGCKALVIAAEEDFGLMPLEAFALGKPVIALKKGGAMETVVDGETGYFFENQEVDSLVEALIKLETGGLSEERCKEAASRFSKARFVKSLLELVKSN